MQLHFILSLATALLAANPATALPFVGGNEGVVVPSQLYHAGPSSAAAQHAFVASHARRSRQQKAAPPRSGKAGGQRRRDGVLASIIDLVSPRSVTAADAIKDSTARSASFTKQRRADKKDGKKRRRQTRRRRSNTAAKTTTTPPCVSSSDSSSNNSNSSKAGDGGDTSSSKSEKTATAATATSSAVKSTSTAKTDSPIQASTNITTTAKSGVQQVLGGYWPNWAASTLAPEDIDWAHYDYINYAFAVPQSDGTVNFDGDEDKALLKRLIAAAHGASNPSKVVLSVGGWGNSGGFSDAVASSSAIANFVQTFVNLQKKYDLDGFDFDWEYPGNVQGGTSSGSDTRNFQTFLQKLRAALPAGQLLTAAVPQTVWIGSNGNPVGSVARAAGALDYIVIMNYDVNGASSTPGPNAPLADLCGTSSQPTANAAAGVKQWTKAKMPRSKILLGVPAYGYVQKSSKTKLKARDTLKNGDGSTSDGQVNFRSIVKQGALKKGSDGLFDGANGWTKYWDDCSDTPYLANGDQVVTYDDTSSLRDKAAFSKLSGIAGVNMWSIDGDTKAGDLRNALLLGFQVEA